MSVAKAYARALFEAVADGKPAVTEFDMLEEQMGQFVTLFETSKELRTAFLAPGVSAKEKVALVQSLSQKMQLSKSLTGFLALLARKQRFVILPEIRDAFRKVRLEAEGGILGHLVSADPLESKDVEDLSRAFSQKLGRKVAFRTETDSNLLAGMKVTVNGVTYDGSLRSQLQRLRDRLVHDTGTTH
jgi:F-type H+-transporting ATPase subunit delta